MTNYYKVIKNIAPDMNVEDIKKELLAQENAWRRREITSPEKAQEMLVYINQAKKVFASPANKAAYDRELEESRKKPVAADPQAERYQQYKKWYGQAMQYVEKHQYDLAKTAIDKALSLSSQEFDDPWFYNDAATIYRENHDYTTALNYINKALVLDESEAMFYITKGLICYNQADDPDAYVKDRGALIAEAFNLFKTSINYAKAKNDIESIGLAYSLMAHVTYRQIQGREQEYYASGQSVTNTNAYQYAKNAVKYGDPWGMGQNILTSLDAITKEQKRREDESNSRMAEEARKKYEYENASAFDLVRESKKKPDPIVITDKEIKEFYNSLPVDEWIEKEAKNMYRRIRSSLSEQIEIGKPYTIVESYNEFSLLFAQEIRDAFSETYPSPKYAQNDTNTLQGIRLFSYSRAKGKTGYTVTATEHGKRFIRQLNELCKMDSISIGIAYSEYSKDDQSFVKLGSVNDNPSNNNTYILAVADNKLRKHAEKKGIVLDALPKWSKTIDEFQEYVDRGFKDKVGLWDIIALVFFIALFVFITIIVHDVLHVNWIICGIIGIVIFFVICGSILL